VDPHAWVSNANGKAVELTWRAPALAYFGVVFRTQDVARWIRQNSSLGSMLPDLVNASGYPAQPCTAAELAAISTNRSWVIPLPPSIF
jgi:hypothetical protein